MKKIGLVLGGGGARGLAHIAMLEVFDALGLRPHLIAGTSIGAVLGALYASGVAGAKIRETVRGMVISQGDSFREALGKKDALRWVKFLDLQLGRGGLFKGDAFIQFLYDIMRVKTFAELAIPLRVVATDFYAGQQVVLDAGDLLAAVKASMGLPGVFTPVLSQGRVLIDGGAVNPLPCDLCGDCDLVVAVDVMGEMARSRRPAPSLPRAVLGTFDIMQRSLIAATLKSHPPDIYIRPALSGVDILEFYKAEEIYRQAAPAARQLRAELETALAE